MGAQTFVPHGTHINFDSLIFDLGAGPRVKESVWLRCISWVLNTRPILRTQKKDYGPILDMGMVCTLGAQTFVPHGTHINFDVMTA